MLKQSLALIITLLALDPGNHLYAARKKSPNGPGVQIIEIESKDHLLRMLKQNPTNLVYVYAKWCGICTQVEKEGLLKTLAQQNPDLTVLKLNESITDAKKHVNVRGFPTFIFYAYDVESSRMPGKKSVAVLQQEIDKIKPKAPMPTPKKPVTPPPAAQAPKPETPMPMPTKGGAVITVQSERHFNELLQKPQHKILDFYTVWCGPCKDLAPVFSRLATEYPHVLFLSIDAEKVCSPAQKYNVTGYPTMVILDAQNKVIRKDSGFGRGPAAEATLKARIDQAVGGPGTGAPTRILIHEESIRMN